MKLVTVFRIIGFAACLCSCLVSGVYTVLIVLDKAACECSLPTWIALGFASFYGFTMGLLFILELPSPHHRTR